MAYPSTSPSLYLPGSQPNYQPAVTGHFYPSTVPPQEFFLHYVNPPLSVSQPEPDLPEDIRRHIDTLSTLCTDTLDLMHLLNLSAGEFYRAEICDLLKKIKQSFNDLDRSWRGKDERQMKAAEKRLLKSRISDLLCDVIVKGLEIDGRSPSDDDMTKDPLTVLAEFLVYDCPFNRLFLPPSLTEVWCRVREDDRLLTVLLDKLNRWFQPHMDNTLSEPQDELLESCLKFIRNIAQHNNRRDRLRQLNTTRVLTPYLKSADYNWYAARALGDIVTEDEVYPGLVTDFVDAAPHLDYESIEYLVKNDAIRQYLVENGAVGWLIECVRQAGDEDEKDEYAVALRRLLSEAEYDVIPESDVRDLFQLVLETQHCHGWEWLRVLKHLVLKAGRDGIPEKDAQDLVRFAVAEFVSRAWDDNDDDDDDNSDDDSDDDSDNSIYNNLKALISRLRPKEPNLRRQEIARILGSGDGGDANARCGKRRRTHWSRDSSLDENECSESEGSLAKIRREYEATIQQLQEELARVKGQQSSSGETEDTDEENVQAAPKAGVYSQKRAEKYGDPSDCTNLDMEPLQEHSTSTTENDDVSESHPYFSTDDPRGTVSKNLLAESHVKIKNLEEQIQQYQETIADLANKNRKLEKIKNDLEEEKRKDERVRCLEQQVKKNKELDEVHRRYREEYERLCQERNKDIEELLDNASGGRLALTPTVTAPDDLNNQVTISTEKATRDDSPVLLTCPVAASTSAGKQVTTTHHAEAKKAKGDHLRTVATHSGACTPWKAGVYTEEEVQGSEMVQLVAGFPVYLRQADLQKELKSSTDGQQGRVNGTKLSRRLLKTFFTVEDRKKGTLTRNPRPGYEQLNSTITEAIKEFCVSKDPETTMAEVGKTMATSLTQLRSKGKNRTSHGSGESKEERNPEDRELQRKRKADGNKGTSDASGELKMKKLN